jgi:hypothetical protein
MTTLVDLLGYSAATAAIGTLSMTTMIPLRVLSLASNILFIAYAWASGVQTLLLLHCLLLPVNCWRLWQLLRVLRQVSSAAATESLSVDWLRPFGHRRRFEPGQTVFRAGDRARHLYVVLSGRFRMIENQWDVTAGTLLGELGFVAPDHRRSMGVRCVEGGELLVVSYHNLKTLYFQSPAFAFYLLRLVSERLFSKLEALERGGPPSLVLGPASTLPAPLDGPVPLAPLAARVADPAPMAQASAASSR